jgi:hypothetical protein
VNWRHVGAVELVIHPAKAVESALFGGLTESRLREYETFRNPQLVGALNSAGVRLVDFNALARGGSAVRKEKAA